MKLHKLGCKLVMVLGCVLAGGGLFIVFFNKTSLFNLLNDVIDPLFWHDEPISNATLNFKSFMWSYVGMLTALWGIGLYFVSKYGLMKREAWAWYSIFLSIVSWFILDTWFSISAKVYFNVVLNFLFLTAFTIPLFMTRQSISSHVNT